jgi:ketosteroid isomerase-like protein
MDDSISDDIDRLLEQIDAANLRMLEGDPQLWKGLLAHTDDVVILGAYGGHVRGWDDVAGRFDQTARTYGGGGRTSRDNLVRWIGDDLAYTVDLEHHEWSDANSGQVKFVYRTTHVLRRGPDGWKVVLRHADPLATFKGPGFAHGGS